jgi:hypothetical protein
MHAVWQQNCLFNVIGVACCLVLSSCSFTERVKSCCVTSEHVAINVIHRLSPLLCHQNVQDKILQHFHVVNLTSRLLLRWNNSNSLRCYCTGLSMQQYERASSFWANSGAQLKASTCYLSQGGAQVCPTCATLIQHCICYRNHGFGVLRMSEMPWLDDFCSEHNPDIAAVCPGLM